MSEFFQGIPYAILLLVLGFLLLVKGADAFVEGCSSIAKRFHVPSLIIGMTIVAMGTSLPETAVSITASVSGNNALAVSNAVGSNIFNLMIVVGVCAVLTPVAVQIGILKRDFPLSIGCAVLLLILGAVGMTLGHVDGAVFIVLFALFILYMIRSARKSGKGEAGEKDELLAEAEEMTVADSRSPRNGRFIEEIGTYNPNTNPSEFKIDEELAKKWLTNGAQPTDVVAKLLKVAGIEK